MSEGMSRRSFNSLASGVLAGALAMGLTGGSETPSSPYAAEVSALQDAVRPYRPEQLTPNPAPAQEQLAIASNGRLQRLGQGATHAIVVVHPGYLRPWAADAVKNYGQMRPGHLVNPAESVANLLALHSTAEKHAYNRQQLEARIAFVRGSEGDYGAYLAQLKQVFAYGRRHPEVPFVVYRQLPDVRLRWQDAALKAPEHAITVITEPDSPVPQASVSYRPRAFDRIKQEPQDVQALYDRMRQAGTKIIYLAGENGLYRGGGIYPACAGTVATELLSEGFAVHGYRGAVFPSRPLHLPSDPTSLSKIDGGEQHAAMARALHFETVQLPSSF